MSVEKVRIRHEETDQESTVVASAVPGWESVGWTRVDDEGSQEAATPPEASAPDVAVTKVKNGGPAVPDTSKKE